MPEQRKPSPSDVGPGVVLRVRMGGGACIYTSRRMTVAEAQNLRDRLKRDMQDVTEAGGWFTPFPADGWVDPVDLRIDKITALEIARVSVAPPNRPPEGPKPQPTADAWVHPAVVAGKHIEVVV